MAPTIEPTTKHDPSPDLILKYKEIVKSNGIHETVAEVLIKDSDLVGENFGSKTQVVTIKFENSNVKPLNLFVKTFINSGSHTKLFQGMKAFEKEARFFMKYLPAVSEFCKSFGYRANK